MPSIVEFKTRFFRDLDKIQNATERAAKRSLSRFGAFVRTRARSSMRRRKKASAAGQPPSAHVGLIKQFLFFAYEPRDKNVVIGPALLGGKSRSGQTVPELQEYGGETQVQEAQLSGDLWVGQGRVKIDGRPVRLRRAKYPERPYMRPAWEAELPKAPGMFKDSIR